MTMYKYLKSKYGKKKVSKLFNKFSLDKTYSMPVRGLRGSGSTTLTVMEAYLGGYVVMSVSDYYIPASKDFYKTHLIVDEREAQVVNKILSHINGTIAEPVTVHTLLGIEVKYTPSRFFDNTTSYFCKYKGLSSVYLKEGPPDMQFIAKLDDLVRGDK